MKKISLYISTSLFVFLPMMVFAAPGDLTGVTNFAEKIGDFINDTLIPLIFAIALLVFIYGMFKYFILGGADPEKQGEGKSLMLYAVVGFVLMVSIFGIVNLIADGFGFSNQPIQSVPSGPTIG